MTILEAEYNFLTAHLNSSKNEEAAYLFARIVNTLNETRLLVREVIPVSPQDISFQTPLSISIQSRSCVHAVKKSKQENCALIFVHSHPTGETEFSDQDDREESWFFNFVHCHNPQSVHASMVVSIVDTRLVSRVWLPDGTITPIQLVRVIGTHWRFLFTQDENTAIPEYFDRQVLAFGPAIQHLLQSLHIGIVGAGGTGSAVAEQLIRLGVGQLTVIDHDCFDNTNVNRVYGSSIHDIGIPKVSIVAKNAQQIGLGTKVNPIQKHLGAKSAVLQLRDCDLVFGCTDDQWGRSILSRFAIYYLVPVVDLGVLIDPEGDVIRTLTGRVTILQPGYPCLFCRERINSDRVTAESILISDPTRAANLAEEGYISGVQMHAPAVVSFTSAIASIAVAEFLDRLISFKTAEQKSNELIFRFEADKFCMNSRISKQNCFCSNKKLWGQGDHGLFLGITWGREE